MVRSAWSSCIVPHLADKDRYFCSRSQMPSHPTLGAFKRAMTYSFGSICFGSLIVSIIQLLKQAASIAQQSEAMDGNLVACCLWAVANCILGLVLWLIEYFNVSVYQLNRERINS